MKIGEDSADPDELQLMDEGNRVWVQAWKQATAYSSVIKVVTASHRTPRR